MRALLASGAVLVAVAVAGEFVPAAAYLCLISPLFEIGLGVFALTKAFKRPAYLIVLPVLLVAFGLGSRVVLGVPRWVRTSAAPTLMHLEAWHREHGTYPAQDELSLPHHCLYSTTTNPDRFRLTCQGVLFTHCTYDSELGDWYGWD